MNCFKCGTILTTGDKSGIYGQSHNICRNCHRQSSRDWGAANLSQRAVYNASYYTSHKPYFQEYYREYWQTHKPELAKYQKEYRTRLKTKG
jgi:hypothetical protein